MTIPEFIKHLSFRKQKTILSASLVLAVTFGLSAILGFLRSRFLYANFFSCCAASLDVYNAAFRIPDLLFKLLVSGALSASFIPVFTSYLHKDEKNAYQLASNVINFLGVIFIGLSILVAIFARPFSELIASGFSPSQIDLMVNLTRILLISQVFFLVSSFLTGILQVNQIFIVSSLSPLLYNLAIIASIFLLAPFFGIYGVVYGTVIGAFLHLIIQIPVVIKVGFKYTFNFSVQFEGVKKIVRLMIPRTISLGMGELQNTVTLFFASSLAVGSFSLLNLAIQVMYLPSRIFGTTIGQASLPALSKNIAKNELDIFRKTVYKTILQSLFIALPVMVFFIVLRVPLVRIIFGAKHFPWIATLTTAKILALLAPAIATQAIIQILIRSFYAMHNTKTPLFISFVSLIITVLSSYYFITYTNLGVSGLAISDSIGNIIQSIGLIYFFNKIVDGDFLKIIVRKSIKLVISSFIMALSLWGSLRILDLFILDTTRTVNLIILFVVTSSIGFFVYLACSYILKIEEMADYLGYIKRLRK